ncbi:hypothetical protein I550_3958 [Mycobacterium intracellulare 1956]|uniref:Uncharacterized protein n=1 Tax=Mycobacterium intracellulare 1956 TaxID=1299331 RepID=X8CJ21_MYCIT|nr:hypothetical protein I550_3958 [Mycobacterium intracellulare 1956]
MCRDLAGRQSFCRQRQYDLINTGQATLSFLDDLRVEAAVGVTGTSISTGPISVSRPGESGDCIR